MKDRAIKPTSVRLERPLYEALSGLSQAADLPVGKLLRLAVIDYIGRIETGGVRLPQLGESVSDKDGVMAVIKKYRETTKSRKPAGGPEPQPPDALAKRLEAIESRLDSLEKSSPKANGR